MKTRVENSVKILKLFTFILISISITAGCSKSSDTTTGTPGTNEVFIQSFAFSPTPINITVNGTVTWTNKDGVTHTVTSDNGLFESGSLSTNGTYSHQFTTAGTFNYHCSVHPTMLGKVVVQ